MRNECRGSGLGLWRPGSSGGGMARRRPATCPECGRQVMVNRSGRLRVHAYTVGNREEA